MGAGVTAATPKHFARADVSSEVRLSPRLQRTARLLTVGLLSGLSFLIGHTTPELEARPVASAQAMTEAWKLAQNAQSLADSGSPAAALAAWQRAYDLSADPTLLLEIARLERDVGNHARATHAFEQFLAQGEARVPEQRLQLAARQLQASAAKIARLNVQTNVVGAAVELEPERGVANSNGFMVALLLDAGERRLSFGKPGYETRSVVVRLDPGEVRSLRVDLDKAAAGRSETSSSKLRFTRLDAAEPAVTEAAL